ncbi:DNA repair exonuclease SbcCD nuclease subunit [Alteribacillus persepolensis]|uniref:DNA repair exonuclease SbcCD nuclease subunit n=1 Tax=Alteribacillus persepolensis TaxID=568899 RepID=A0A1G8DD58_9BACI|nr:DNA repair exonuclease [Alteribacillus persepolensis]SDH55658.1 DNA repair exonuclease SbcCD nuclease subunit [Alteribacillus persepolensis]
MEPLRFIHAADLHVGSPIPAAQQAPRPLRTQLENSMKTAVARLVEDAVFYEVDFVILAGDLFDQENRSLKSQLFLTKQLNQLKHYHIPVYIVFGNHDPMDYQYAPVGWPENVEIFSSKPEMKVYQKGGEVQAHLYGFSYGKRTIPENIAKTYQRKEGALYHIGILHGQEQNMAGASTYAPFSVQDLLEKQMDYWALGHIHTRKKLNDRIFYPGNIQARHRLETGEKGYLLVEMKPGDIDVSFQPAADVVFETIHLSIDNHDTFNELTEQFIKSMQKFQPKRASGVWIEMELSGSGPLSEYLQEETTKREWLDNVNDIGTDSSPFFYVHRLTDKTLPSYVVKQINEGTSHFLRDVQKAVDYYKESPHQLEEVWKELTQHPAVKRYIDKTDVSTVIDEAARFIWTKWGEGENE